MPARKKSFAPWVPLIIGGGVLALVFSLAANSGADDRLRVWELGLYSQLDMTLGVAPAWDWLMIFTSSAWFIGFSAVAIVALTFAEAWRTRRVHFGRAYAFIFASLLFMVITAAVMEVMADDIRRTSPWHILHGSRHALEEHSDLSMIHFSRRTDILDEISYGWALLIVVLGSRFRRVGVYASVTLLAFAGSNMILGRQWPLTMITSISLGFLTSGIWLLRWQRPLGWVERQGEELFVRLFWRRLLPRGARLEDTPTMQESPMRREQKRRMMRKQRDWAEAIEQVVLPVVAPGCQDYEVFREPPIVDGVASVPSSYVRFLRVPDGTLYVVKSVRRRGNLLRTPHRVQMYARAARMTAVLARHGLPVPAQYWVSEVQRYGGLVRVFVSVEEYIPGRPLNPLSTAELQDGMRLLATMHSVQSRTWGSLDRDASQSFTSYIYMHAQHQYSFMMRRLMTSKGVTFEDRHVAALWHQIEAHLLARQNHGAPFRLIHGDVTAKNILVNSSGQLFLIDFTDSGFDLAGGEAIKAVLFLGRGGQIDRDAAWSAYFEARGPGAWQEFLAEAPAVFAFYALRELSQGRIPVQKHDEPEVRAAAILAWLKRAASMTEDVWGTCPAETRWDQIDALLQGVPVQPEASSSERALVPSELA